MIEQITRLLGGLPLPALVAILILAVVQMGLQIWAIIDLIRRDTVRFRKKWIWLLIIVGGSLLGPLLYFAIGRTAHSLDEVLTEDRAADRERWEAGLSKLYRDTDRK